MTPSPVELLESGRHSLAIVNNGNTYVFDGRGVADHDRDRKSVV